MLVAVINQHIIWTEFSVVSTANILIKYTLTRVDIYNFAWVQWLQLCHPDIPVSHPDSCLHSYYSMTKRRHQVC
jgi:hypothetical protein